MGVLVIVIAIIACIIGDDLIDHEPAKIPDEVGLPISIIGGAIAGIGGIIIGRGASLGFPANILLGAIICIVGAVVSYIGNFVADLR